MKRTIRTTVVFDMVEHDDFGTTDDMDHEATPDSDEQAIADAKRAFLDALNDLDNAGDLGDFIEAEITKREDHA